MRTFLCLMIVLWAAMGAHGQVADSLKPPDTADSLYVIPAGPLAGSFTPSARIIVQDTIAGWAHITVEGWVPVAAIAERLAVPKTAGLPSFQDGPNAPPRQCEAITQKGKRCKRNAEPGSKYCWQHRTH